MLLLYLLDKTLGVSPDKRSQLQQKIKLFQNYYCLFIVLYALYAVKTQNLDTYFSAIHFIKYHCVFDLLLCTPEISIHHCIIFTMIIQILNTPQIFKINTIPEISTILSTEISTIFLVFREILPPPSSNDKKYFQNKIYKFIYNMNDILFIGVFTYTRIYKYTTNLIYNYELWYKMDTLLMPINRTLLTLAIYSLYLLNMYWMCIITKKIVKIFKKYLLTYQKSEIPLRYTYFLSPVISVLIYKPYNNVIYLFDIVGQVFLSVSSYYYHYELSKENNIEKNIHDNNLLWVYLDDVLLIHIRCFLCVFTNINLHRIIEISTKIKIQEFNVKYGLLYLSFISHVSVMYHFVKYVLFLKHNNETLTIHDSDVYKTFPTKLYQGFTILLDSFIIGYNTPDITLRNHLFIITSLVFINGYIMPFYEMTHLVFHILLLFQTGTLSSSNVISNEYLELLSQNIE